MYSPYEALFRASIDVRFGNQFRTDYGWIDGNFLDTDELYELFSGNRGRDSPFYGRTYEEVSNWYRSDRIKMEKQKSDWYEFFWTIEHNLNTCIYYIATALNFLLAEAFTSCDCTGELGDNKIIQEIHQEHADWVEQFEGPWTRAWLEEYNLSSVVTMTSLLLGLVAVAVSKKLSLLIMA
jgi:hypothetical protein